eukprot:6987053-Prorocentrum_lima.AAC.1
MTKKLQVQRSVVVPNQLSGTRPGAPMLTRGIASAIGTWLTLIPVSCIMMSKELCPDTCECAGGDEPGH